MKNIILLILIAIASAGYSEEGPSTPASDAIQASDLEYKSPHTLVGSVSFLTDYRFRGISQTMRRLAVQGTLDYSHKSGFYLGIFASNVDGTSNYLNNTSSEWDFYGGYKSELFCDIRYNVGLYYYLYPGGQVSNPHHTRYNTAEVTFELSYKNFSVRAWQSLTNLLGVCSNNPPFNWDTLTFDSPNGSSRGSLYLEANWNQDLWSEMYFGCLKGKKLNLYLHLGHQYIRHYNVLSYYDWRATLTQEFDWFNIFLTYIGTNGKKDYYDVYDRAYNPERRHLGAQGVVVGLVKIL